MSTPTILLERPRPRQSIKVPGCLTLQQISRQSGIDVRVLTALVDRAGIPVHRYRGTNVYDFEKDICGVLDS